MKFGDDVILSVRSTARDPVPGSGNSLRRHRGPGVVSARSRRLATVLALLLLASSPAAVSVAQDDAAPPEAAEFRVIVHQKNPVRTMKRKEADQMFLGRAKSWNPLGFDAVVEPVNQLADSEVREKFTRAVHKKSLSSISSYWQRMIFSGRGVNPPELSTDQAVIEFVAERPGAIGYISAETSIQPERDKVEVLEIKY